MSFTPRLTRPTAGNKYYIQTSTGGWNPSIFGSPRDSQCNVLHNCVGYALGRFNEIGGYGYCKYLKPFNAEQVWDYRGDLQTSQEPALGACAVWKCGSVKTGSDGAGHVAIVEKIISPTQIVTSESGYNAAQPFWTQTRNKGNGNWGQNTSYQFLGFILNPAVKTETPAPAQPTQPTTPTQPKEEEPAMTYSQFKEYIARYLAELAAEPGSTWSQADRDWATSSGLMQGDGSQMAWHSFLTKEQAAALFRRHVQG